MTTALKVLKAQGMSNDTEACTSHTVISDTTRFYHYNETLNNCDSEFVEGWYKFEINGNPAEIPGTCLKNRLCGTQLPMRLDLDDQTLPDPNTTVWARVCTSYDILGMWDCCVLRQRAGIRNCGDFYVYHLLPTDRCAVGYCIQEAGTTPSKEYLAKTGDPVTVATEVVSTTRPGNDTSNSTTVTESPTTVSTSGPCPQTPAFSCYDGNRTCHNSSRELVVKCSHGPGCGKPCDGVPECEDESDERDLNVCPVPVVCTEGMIQCPGEAACFRSCDGNQECNSGFDETDCGNAYDILSNTTSQGEPSSSILVSTNPIAESSTITVAPINSSLGPPLMSSIASISSPSKEVMSPTTASRARSWPSDVLTSSSAFLTTLTESQLTTTPPLSTSSQDTISTTSTSTRFDSVSETHRISTTATISTATGVQDGRLSSDIHLSSTPFTTIFTSVVDDSSVSMPVLSVSLLPSATATSFSMGSPSIFYSSESSSGVLFSPSSAGGLVQTITSSLTVKPSIPSNTTAGSVVTGPIILTFDIIGTAYRNAQERIEEPTFEEILQQAIADVLNEYSNRDRRGVQNFTGEHVQITHVEKDRENVSVSVAINSTKHGEDFIPVNELETIFRNQSAIGALCNEIFGDPSTLQTRPVTLSSSIFTSTDTLLLSSPYFVSGGEESGTSATPTSSSTTPSATILPVPATLSANTTLPYTEDSLTSTVTKSLEYETGTSLSLLESVVTTRSSLSQADLDTTSITPPVEVSDTEIISSATMTSTKQQTLDLSQFSSNTLADTRSILKSPSVRYAQTDTLTETSSLPYHIETSRTFSGIFLSQTVSASPATRTLNIPSIIPSTEPSFLSTVLPSSLTPDIFSSTHSTQEGSESPTPKLQASSISITDLSVKGEIFSSLQTSESITDLSESISISVSESSSSVIALSQATEMPPSPSLIQTESHKLLSESTTVSQTEPMVTAIYSDTETVTYATSVPADITPSSAVSAVRSSLTDSPSVVSAFELSSVRTPTVPPPGLKPSPSVETSQGELFKPTSVSYPHTEYAVEETSVLMASPIATTSVSHSQTETLHIYPSVTENVTSLTMGYMTIRVETVTVVSTTEGNLTLKRPVLVEEKELFEKNFGLFIFLIVAGACILGACAFVVVAKLYRKRRYSWDPQLAYQDAYADMEKANLSFHRDVEGVESPIPDIDILKGESNEQETSLSKASTMTLPGTPKNEASQTDMSVEPGPSDEPDFTVQSHAISESRDNIAPSGSGHDNQGFETDTDSGVDGIVPIDEIDTKHPRISFPWMDQLADTRL